MSRLFKILGILIVVALIFPACATETAAPEIIRETVEVEVPVEVEVEKVVTATPLPKESVTIRFATLSGPEFTEGYQPIVDMWNAEHPEIQVQYETYPFMDFWVKIPAQHAAGNPPDVFWTGMGTQGDPWIQRGVYAPLDEYIDGDYPLDTSDWDPLSARFGEYNDQTYLLISTINFNGFAYNKDYFDEAGLDYPDETWTWDDLLDAALILTTDVNGNHPDDPGFDPNNVAVWGIQTRFWPVSWYPVLWTMGGRLYSEDKSTSGLDSPEAIEAMQWWTDLVQVHHVAPPYEYFGDAGWDTAFGNGNVAMHWLATNIIAVLDTQFPELNYGVTVVPKAKEGQDPMLFVFGRAFGISSQSQYKEEAWQFLRFLVSPEMQLMYTAPGYGFPTSAAARDEFLAGLDAETAERYAPYVTSLDYIFVGDRGPDEMTTAINPLMEVIQVGTTIDPTGKLPDIPALMQEAADKANNILSSFFR